ncbi:MAG: dihydrolipoyl dehydrogenase [Lentisphaeria bacterium]|jgi:dihydrolipoamide dehydrogenase
MYDLIVIGAGPGGYEAAAYAATRFGKKVALVERNALGGTCLNVGCIPTKTLLRSARALADCHAAAAYGVAGAESATLDLKKVQARKAKVVATLAKGIAGMLQKAKVEVIQGEGRLAGRGKVAVNGQVLEGANILLATGSRPAVPPIPGLKESPAVLDSTGILDLQEIPASLVVIGGGVIGLEFACFFAELGTKVTVVEMLPRIAPVIDEEIANRLQLALKKAGVEFNLSCKVTKIEGSTLTFLDKDGQEQTRPATWILNSTGRVPVLAGLGLEEAGVEFDRRGVKTDEFGKTNLPGVWACGDVTGRCQLAHAATREGIVAVNNMFGRPDRMRYSAVPSVVYTHPEVASVGRTEEELKTAGVAYRKALLPMGVAGRFLVEYEGQSGSVKALVGAAHGELLGVHMIGGCCGEFVATAAALIESEQRVEEIREIIFPHPTVSEALKEAVLHAG